jgi:hypothetical protein
LAQLRDILARPSAITTADRKRPAEGTRRMQDAGYPGSLLAKTLIMHYEPSGRISVILVPETLGF